MEAGEERGRRSPGGAMEAGVAEGRQGLSRRAALNHLTAWL